MALLVLIILLGLFASLAILLARFWRRRRQTKATPSVAPTLAINGQHTTLVDQMGTSWHKRMGWHAQPNPEHPRLRAWLITNLTAQSAAQSWIVELTDAEFSVLQQRLHTFCTSVQIDLAWLGQQSLAKDPTLQAAIHAIVLHYVQAQQQAASVQAELLAFQTYLALLQRPYSYEYQPRIQQLYTQLIDAGLATPVRPEALRATEKLRVEHMLRTIEAATNANRPAFYRILNTLNNPHQHNGATIPLSPAALRNSQPEAVAVK